MKIKPAGLANQTPEKDRRSRQIRVNWWNASLLISLLSVSFVSGALIYRAGILHPVTAFVKGVMTQGRFYPELPSALEEVAVAVQDEFRLYQENGLPTLYIDLPFESYQRLLEKRDEAIEIGVLNTTDDDFVAGQVQLQNGPKLDAKLRLKGDWTDHLEGDKWSFRIHLKDEGQISGMTQFSIQTPLARNFLYEWAFHKNLQEEGLLAPRYSFINVLVNGRLLGIYALEENFAPELLELQGRRAGVIIRFNEDPYWQNVSVFRAAGFTQESHLSITTMDSAEISVFQESKVALDPILAAEAETARGLLRAFQTGERPASEIFDVEQTGLFFALHDLWKAEHGVAWHNLRFYYNPVTGLLEPVAFDAMPFYTQITEPTLVSVFLKTRIFNDPEIRTSYARHLERITRQSYIDQLEQELGAEHDRLKKSLEVEFQDYALPPYYSLSVDWDRLRQQAEILSLELQPKAVVRGSFTALNMIPGSTGSPELIVDLVNLTILPVEIDYFEVNGDTVTDDGLPFAILPVSDPGKQVFESSQIRIALSGSTQPDQTASLQVVAVGHITGLRHEFRVELSGAKMPESIRIGPLPRQPTIEEALAQHPFLRQNPNRTNTLVIPPGAWDVTGDLILPSDVNLQILADVTLRFSAGSILYSSGAVDLLGEPNASISLTGQDAGGWGGIIISNADDFSHWEYAIIEKTTGINRNGWTLTGGITFFKSNIYLDHVLLGNNQTEDAINVIHSSFQFFNSTFSNTYADAFDGDFSNGVIENCTFSNISGDAVDVSGAKVEIRDTKMEHIGDKGVSAGEESEVTVTNVHIYDVGIGVASKDLSRVILRQSSISKARFSALSAFIKKPVYGPAWLDAQEVAILETETPAVAQKGSTILIDGQKIETVDLDVDRLYTEGILGN